MSQLKKPLATLNGTGSRLPRLPVPKAGSKMPIPMPVKRSRSPDSLPVQKRICLDRSRTSTESNTSTRSRTSTESNSSTSSTSRLRPQTSGSSLRANKVTLNKPKPVPVKSQPSTKTTTRTGVTRSTSSVKPAPKPNASVPRGRQDNNKTLVQSSGTAPKTSGNAPSGGGKKRPAWDLKGRLQDMEELLGQEMSSRNELKMQLQNYYSHINSLEKENSHLSGTVAQKEQVASVASVEIDTLKRQIREAEEKFDSMKRNFQSEISDLNFFKDSLERQKCQLDGEVTAARTEINGLKSTIAQMTSAQAGMSAELEATKLSLENALREGRQKDEEIKNLKGIVKSQEETIEEFNVKFREHETERRKLHNTIQELKGNIRVFCRVRPLLGDECLGNNGEVQHMNFPDLDQKVLELEKIGDVTMNESCLTASRRGNKFEFSFDRVFQPNATQADVFEEVSQLIQSALDGYNVCIFAYGQTGSGKTYTMEGGAVDDLETRGVIPRAVVQIFDSVKELQSKGWKIYNETIRDLLGNGKDELKHEIKLTGTTSNDVTVTNLTLVNVETEGQIYSLLKKASHNRAVAETKCNEHSSRSHSVFRLKLSGQNSLTGEACVGTLNLVDLAGSERLKESGSEGQRLKETLSINKSLSTLGNVIMALGNKDNHIPYRNSKLTYLLQNSLGGNSKTLMFVNASPREECFQETLNSLRFATKVNQCNIGTAQKKSK